MLKGELKLFLFLGSATDFVLQEPGPRGDVAGLCGEVDVDDPEHYRICETDTGFHAAQPGRPGKSIVPCQFCFSFGGHMFAQLIPFSFRFIR